MMTGALPGLETRPDALRAMANVIAVGHQLEIDANQGATAHFQAQRNILTSTGGQQYQPMATFYKAFNDQFPAEVGIAAAKALSGDPAAAWTKGLTPQQQDDALRLAWRTDPSAEIGGHRNPALQK